MIVAKFGMLVGTEAIELRAGIKLWMTGTFDGAMPLVAPDRTLWIAGMLLVGTAVASALDGKELSPGIRL